MLDISYHAALAEPGSYNGIDHENFPFISELNAPHDQYKWSGLNFNSMNYHFLYPYYYADKLQLKCWLYGLDSY